MLGLLATLFPVLAAASMHDVCNSSLFPVPLELGDSGTVMASWSSWGAPLTSSVGFPDSPLLEGCRLQLLGCDSCRLRLSMHTMSFPGCNETLASQTQYPVCVKGCMHVILYEPSYADVSTSFLFDYNATWSYYSISSSVVIIFCNNVSKSLNISAEFSLLYQVIDKQEVHFGSARNKYSSQGVMQSPNFPNGYALRGEVYNYLLRNLDRRGRIRVVFDDWDLAEVSRVLFYENESSSGEPFSVHFGSSIRPVILSSGRTLLMTFRPDVGLNARTENMGFRATYQFIKGKNSKSDAPITDCGMYFKYSPGGQVQFHGTELAKEDGRCDCVWVITKQSAFNWLLLIVHNVTFAKSNIQLDVHEGVTSVAPLVATINATSGDSEDLTLEGRAGFYLRLKGAFTVNDFFDITYTSFDRPLLGGECKKAGALKCRSSPHCIDRHLGCDNYPHCPDASDEKDHCQGSPVVTLPPPEVQCSENEFTCANKRRCIPKSALCDRWLDCPDASDEYACAPPVTVKTSLIIPVDIISTVAAEVTCLHGEWLCHSKNQCIQKVDYCDGVFNCIDRSDESDCFMGLQSKSLSQAPWSILMPVGIALCVALFICVVSLCIRSHLKHQQECGVAYSSGRPGNNFPTPAGRGRSRRPKGRTQRRTLRSITSETPLTLNLNLSRSTSGVAVSNNNQAESPPSYEEAMRLSPEGCSDTVRRLMISHDLNCGFPGGNRPGRMSPSQLLTPPTYTPSTSETSPSSLLGQTCFVFPSASDNAGCTGSGSSGRFGSKDRDKNKPSCSSCGSKHVINLDADDQAPPVCADCSYSTPSLNRNGRQSTKGKTNSVENIFLQINGSQSQINLNSLNNNSSNGNHRNSLKGTKHQSLPRDVPGLSADEGANEPTPSTSQEVECHTAPASANSRDHTPANSNTPRDGVHDVKLPFRRDDSSSSSFSQTSSSGTNSSSNQGSLPQSSGGRPKLRERPLGHSAETDKSSSSDRLPQRRRPVNLHRGGSMDNFTHKNLHDMPLGGSMESTAAPGSCGPRRKFRDMPLGGSLDNTAANLDSPVLGGPTHAPSQPVVVPPPRTTSLLASLIERGTSSGISGKSMFNSTPPVNVQRSESMSGSGRLSAAASQHTSLPIDSNFLKRSLGDSLPGIYETRLLRTPSPRVSLPNSHAKPHSHSTQNISNNLKRGPYREPFEPHKYRNNIKNHNLVDSAISRDLSRHLKSLEMASHLDEHCGEEEEDDTYDVIIEDIPKPKTRPNFLNLSHVNPGSKHTVL